MNLEQIQQINKTIENKVWENFCLAKFHHVTVLLHTWETKSCCHVPVHTIPLGEIKDNPSALHNTKESKRQRKIMLEGKKLNGCEYCWNVEKSWDAVMSARRERTATIYTPNRLQEIIEGGSNHNINPEYIELNFGNTCQFKCWYCKPKSSSSIQKEIETFWVYNTKNHSCNLGKLHMYEEENNPYIDAWWKWWPELRKTLNILRITWWEPLLQKSTWELFDNIQSHPLPHLEVSINSNFWVWNPLIQKLCSYVNTFEKNGSIRDFRVFTSIDNWWKKAEYIRNWLNLEVWEKNFFTYLDTTWGDITIMVTCNSLSITSFKSLLKKVLEWRKKYPKLQGQWNSFYTHRIMLSITYVRKPIQFDMNILPKQEFMPYMYESLKFIEDNIVEWDSTMFNEVDYHRFKSVLDYMENTSYPQEKLIEWRVDFYLWFQEHDKRRKTNFLETFPEYRDFLERCKKTIAVKKYLRIQKENN